MTNIDGVESQNIDSEDTDPGLISIHGIRGGLFPERT